MENMKNDIGYESSDGDDSNASIKTVESVSRKGDNLESHVPPLTPSLRQFSRRSTAANSLLSTAQVRFQECLHVTQNVYFVWDTFAMTDILLYFLEFYLYNSPEHPIHQKRIPECDDRM